MPLATEARSFRPWLPLLLRGGALLAASLCLLPMLAVVLAALSGGTGTLAHLGETVLPRYSWATLQLVVLVSVGTGLIGTGAAWLVTMRLKSGGSGTLQGPAPASFRGSTACIPTTGRTNRSCSSKSTQACSFSRC